MPPSVESALLASVLEAENLIGPQRMRHDPSALAGVPAHITLRYPFIPRGKLRQIDMSRLWTLIGEIEPFITVLATVNRFPGVVWLTPEPTEPLLSLRRVMGTEWPEYPPYGRGIDSKDIVPHRTVSHLDGAEADGLIAALQGGLPITSRVEEVSLMTSQEGRWTRRASFRLGGWSPRRNGCGPGARAARLPPRLGARWPSRFPAPTWKLGPGVRRSFVFAPRPQIVWPHRGLYFRHQLR